MPAVAKRKGRLRKNAMPCAPQHFDEVDSVEDQESGRSRPGNPNIYELGRILLCT